MRIIELDNNPPSMTALLEAALKDDVILVRSGHPLVRLEKFDDDDWEDWKYEHSPASIERGELARKEYRKAEFRVLTRKNEPNRLSRAHPSVRALYQRYKKAILDFGKYGGDVSCRSIGRGASFFVNGRRIATFTIQKG